VLSRANTSRADVTRACGRGAFPTTVFESCSATAAYTGTRSTWPFESDTSTAPVYEPGAAVFGTFTVNLTTSRRPRRTVVRPGSLTDQDPALEPTVIARLPSDGFPVWKLKVAEALVGPPGAEWRTKLCVCD
jgi:hypothetical protein